MVAMLSVLQYRELPLHNNFENEQESARSVAYVSSSGVIRPSHRIDTRKSDPLGQDNQIERIHLPKEESQSKNH